MLAGAALVLIEPIARGRIWACRAVLVVLVAIASLWESRRALLLLAVPPVVFTGWMAWLFGGRVRRGHVLLITRSVAGLYRPACRNISPVQSRYACRLTLVWTLF